MLKIRSNFRKGVSLFSISLLILNLAFFSFTQEAEAALSAVGPIQPTSGFPLWYQDSNGMRLDLMEAADTYGISDPVNPANPFSEQIGFNAEGFWWSADASMGSASLVLAMEAAFGGEEAVDGEQSAFGRIRIRADVNEPGTYVVKHPYGTKTFEVTTIDAGKEINDSSDIGCFGLPGFPCNFNIPLTSGIGPFLTWNTYNPNPALTDPQLKNLQPGYTNRQYVGNPLFDHAVSGSPVGQNYFRIEGPNIGGPGVNFIQQNLFAVTGRIYTPVISQTKPVPNITYDRTPSYTFNSTDAGTITYGGDCTSTKTNAVLGANVITFNTLNLGNHNNCTIKVTNSDLKESNTLNIPSFTVSVYPDIVNHWAKIYIQSLVDKGIMTGYTQNSFKPYETIKRSDLIRMVVLAKGYTLVNPATPTFSDVPKSYWAYKYIETARANGVINGNGSTFAPEAKIPRDEVAKFIVKASGAPYNTSGIKLKDTPISYWAYKYIMTVKNANIMSYYSGGYFKPKNLVTRGEAAKMIHVANSGFGL